MTSGDPPDWAEQNGDIGIGDDANLDRADKPEPNAADDATTDTESDGDRTSSDGTGNDQTGGDRVDSIAHGDFAGDASPLNEYWHYELGSYEDREEDRKSADELQTKANAELNRTLAERDRIAREGPDRVIEPMLTFHISPSAPAEGVATDDENEEKYEGVQSADSPMTTS